MNKENFIISFRKRQNDVFFYEDKEVGFYFGISDISFGIRDISKKIWDN